MPKPLTDEEREAEEYKRISGDTGDTSKSEAVRELFDFKREKLKQRTRLNLKEVLSFANLRAFSYFLHKDPADDRLLAEIWMDEVMEHKLSLDGRSRQEGMSIFQMQNEEVEMEKALKQ